MSLNKSIAGTVVFAVFSVGFLIGLIYNLCKGQISVNSIPAIVMMVGCLVGFIWNLIRLIKQVSFQRGFVSKEQKFQFNPTVKSRGIWVDEDNKLWQTRYTFVPRVFKFSDLSDYKIVKKTVRRTTTNGVRARTGFGSVGTASSTSYSVYSYIGIEIKLANRKRIRWDALNTTDFKNVTKALEYVEDTAELLDYIKKYNRQNNH